MTWDDIEATARAGRCCPEDVPEMIGTLCREVARLRGLHERVKALEKDDAENVRREAFDKGMLAAHGKQDPRVATDRGKV